jgi:hypothetical protein
VDDEGAALAEKIVAVVRAGLSRPVVDRGKHRHGTAGRIDPKIAAVAGSCDRDV